MRLRNRPTDRSTDFADALASHVFSLSSLPRRLVVLDHHRTPSSRRVKMDEKGRWRGVEKDLKILETKDREEKGLKSTLQRYRSRNRTPIVFSLFRFRRFGFTSEKFLAPFNTFLRKKDARDDSPVVVNHRKREESGREINRSFRDRSINNRGSIDSIEGVKISRNTTRDEGRVIINIYVYIGFCADSPNKTRLDEDWARATREMDRLARVSGKRNDLINFPTGLDSAGLPAGDFVAESPWPTGRSRKVFWPRDDRNLDVTNNLRDVGRRACDSNNRSNHDFTFSRFILLAGNTQSSVTLASPASASKCRS